MIELVAYINPPVDVKLVCEGVLVLMGGKAKPDWTTIKKEISKTNFVEKILHLSKNDKDRLPGSRMKRLAELTKKKPTFTPEY